MLEVSLLGEQQVTEAGGTPRLRSSRTLALIAFLVVHAGSPQPRQRIAGVFWPDSTEEQALTNLRRELHHLRAVLGEDPSLIVTPRTLCWQDTPGCVVDVRIFTAAAAGAREAARREQEAALLAQSWTALDAYRGEFLPGGLEDWVLDARNALEQQCVEVLDLVVTARTRAGQLPAALTASGRAMLAALPPAGVRALFPDASSLVARNDRGPRSLSGVRRLLSETRRRGFALEDGEVTADFASVAAAVLDHTGHPVAAVALTFPCAEVPTDSRRQYLASHVTRTAAVIAKRLGG